MKRHLTMNAWLVKIHAHCTATKTAAKPDGEGFTIREALDRFGVPVTQSTPMNLLRLAVTAGKFRSVRERCPPPYKRGRWYEARYFAVGQTPVSTKPIGSGQRTKGSQFAGVIRANSIFDLAEKFK